jgi:hypothetical protein
MTKTREQTYTLILVSCLAGYAWLYYALYFSSGGQGTLCLFKNITGIACPSCGTTRALIALMHLRFSDTVHYNPLGMLMAPVMLVGPLWIMRDLMKKDNSLFIRYRQFENLLRRPAVYLPAIGLLLANWTWNILKGL